MNMRNKMDLARWDTLNESFHFLNYMVLDTLEFLLDKSLI